VAITLAQLRDRVQVLYDISGSAVLSVAQWNTLVNDGIRAMWAIVTRINKDFRVTTVAPFSLTSVPSVALAADFREMRAVRVDPGTQNQVYLQKLSMRNGSQQFARSWRLQGTSLYIEPIQNCAGTYDYVYIPLPPVLVADGDVFDVELEQFQDFVVYHAVVQALAREESDITQAAQVLGTAEAALTGWASDQRAAEPDQIEDVRKRTAWLWASP
jgi:hypothetical protein